MIDLGTLGGGRSAAVAVADGWVVGTAAAADNHDHVFAYDLNSPHPRLIDLGDDLGDPAAPDTTTPVAVGGGWAVGGPVFTRGGLVGHAWAVQIPGA
jgi:hypothetical protein